MIGKVWSYARNAEHNVKLAYLFTITYFSCNSIIFQQVLSGFIFVLTGSNEPVGVVKGVQGITQMIAAIPGGWACDHFRRDTILKVASVLGVFCAVLSMVAFYIGHMMLIYVTFGCWGLFSALQSPALEALFADSIPNGERSFPITVKHMLMNTAFIVGPAICVVFFLIYGDSWNLGTFFPRRPLILRMTCSWIASCLGAWYCDWIATACSALLFQRRLGLCQLHEQAKSPHALVRG
ncbi:hypothetical protein AC1031_010745 [Aphanomyces cochlioides]|nr:hypothetical protein AC1031_010745 [Aphanomyces cochlioides]